MYRKPVTDICFPPGVDLAQYEFMDKSEATDSSLNYV